MNGSEKERAQIAKIRYGYEAHEESKLETLKKLDKKVKTPADAVAYSLGSAGTLVLGTGMCLALKAIGATLHPAIGIVIGVAGMGIMVANYFLYRVILKKRRKKYAAKIIALSDEALNG